MAAARVSLLIALLPLLAVAGEPVPHDVAALAQGNTAFACDLYARLRSDAGNLFLSPYSISTCLAMAREGAAGQTAAEMDAVLHLPDTDVGKAFQTLGAALEPPRVRDGYGREAKEVPAYELTIANRLYGQEGYAFRTTFLRRLADAYAAPLAQLDFMRSEQARATINAWVEEETRSRIQDLIPPGLPAPDTRLVLVNAVYLKSPWLEPFREGATKEGPFRTSEDREVPVPFMHRTAHYAYGEAEGVQLLEMPYRSRQLSMLVVLPRAVDGLPAVETLLTPEVLAAWQQALANAKVAVTFPRFRFTSGFDLTGVLQRMGMKDAFDRQRADFSGMTAEEELFVGVVLHKGFVAVDEKGTEAAAATAVAMRAGGRPRPEPIVEFRADRPFLFFILHPPTGTVLFVGRVADPTA